MDSLPLDTKKKTIPDRIKIIGLAMIGILILYCLNFIVLYFSISVLGLSFGLQSALYIILVFITASTGFLAVPLAIFWHSRSLSRAATVAAWQIFFILLSVLF